MPNREEKKQIPRKKRDSASKKLAKVENNLDPKKVKDIPRRKSIDDVIIPSNSHLFCDGSSPLTNSLTQTNESELVYNDKFKLNTLKDANKPHIESVTTQYGQTIPNNPVEYSKRRYSKSNGAKYFFFPFLKKSSDPPNPVRAPNIVDIKEKISPLTKQRNFSTGDSSQCSINSSFHSGNSLFSASQYLYSNRASNYDYPTNCFSDDSFNACTSYIINNMYNSMDIQTNIRPNSIAFPVNPLPQSTINLPTCDDSSVRHSIATMPQHRNELAQGTLGFCGINRVNLPASPLIDKCISSPSLEYSELWSPIIPSHPCYSQIANDMMHCSKSISKEPGYFLSDELKRQSLPSDGDSGVAFDHHKRSMVFSGYNSLLSVVPSNPDLSISTQSDYDLLPADESSHLSFDYKFKKDENRIDRPWLYYGIRTVCNDNLSCSSKQHNSNIHEFEECLNPLPCKSDDRRIHSYDTPTINIQQQFCTSLQYLPKNFDGNSNDLSRYFLDSPSYRHHSCFQKDNAIDQDNSESSRCKPRRTKSLKNHPYQYSPSNFLYTSKSSLMHERDVSFYTYIAPDPNHAKEIPHWLEIYSSEDSPTKFNWIDCNLDDLICWNTLLGRLYKKDLEGLIKSYEECRENLINIINERREDLVGERIALENALMSEETYV